MGQTSVCVSFFVAKNFDGLCESQKSAQKFHLILSYSVSFQFHLVLYFYNLKSASIKGNNLGENIMTRQSLAVL